MGWEKSEISHYHVLITTVCCKQDEYKYVYTPLHKHNSIIYTIYY